MTSVQGGRWLAAATTALLGIASVIGFQAFEIQHIQSEAALARETDTAAERLLAVVSDAETGQRGYLLTGSPLYLEPFDSAKSRVNGALSRFLALDHSTAAAHVASDVRAKFAELEQTVRLAEAGDRAGALIIVNSNFGNSIMTKLRSDIGGIAEDNHARAKAGAKLLVRISNLSAIFAGNALLLTGWILNRLVTNLRTRLVANQQLTSALEEKTEAYRLLVSRLERFREEERSHIARELHDELGQCLTGIKMDLAMAKFAWNQGDREKVSRKLAGACDIADQAIRSAREVARQLRPPELDHLPLNDAVRAYVDQFSSRTGVQTQVAWPDMNLMLNEAEKVALFRIVQESLTNVARHAHAKLVNIEASVDEHEFRLRICDDGVGCDTSKSLSGSLGLLGMEERAKSVGAELKFHSETGLGTTIVVRLRLAANLTVV